MLKKIIFLGTGAGMPTIERNVSSLAVLLNDSGEFWLLDCGEGTQQQLLRVGLRLSKLKAIFITHLHGDHVFGLPGLLASRGLQGIKTGIDIFGPVGLEGYLNSCFNYSKTHIPYNCRIHQIEKEKYLTKKLLWKSDHFAVYSALLNHQIDCFGYCILNKQIKRNILTDKLLKLGIKPGPIYRQIKENIQVTLKDGRNLKSIDFIKETKHIKKISYCCDTMFSKNAIILSKDADLLIHEATFSSSERFEAEQSFHSTIEDAIKVGYNAGVKKIALTHISPRYNKSAKNPDKWKLFKEEAVKKYPDVILAKDLMEIKI